MMRISDAMTYTNAETQIDAARSRVNQITAEASGGLRVVQPGDDPAAAAGVVVHSTANSYAQAVSTTATAAAGELQTAEGALNTVSDEVERARELAIQLANDTYNASDRQNAADEIGQIKAAVVAALNVKAGDRYVFGGSQDQTSPFDANGNYLGDSAVRTIEVAPGVQQVASLRADVALKGSNGGVDVLQTLSDLQTALSTNDAAGINTAIGNLETGTEQVAELRSQAGADADALTAAATVATAASAGEVKAVSNLQDADVVDTATQLQLAQTALQAAISASTQSFKFSLLAPNG